MRTIEASNTGGTSRPARGLAGALAGFDAALRGLGAVAVESLGDGELTDLVRTMGAAESRISALKARAVAAAERNGTSARSGAANPVSWLSEVGGGSRRSAHATSKLATAIEAVPSLGQALQDGTIGSEQAQVVSMAVERGVLDDESRDALVQDAAGKSPEELRGFVRRREAMASQDQLRQDEREAKRRRYLRMRRESDGSRSGDYRLDPVMGQLFEEAIAALTKPDAANTPLELQRTGDQRRADALGMLAKLTLEAGDVGKVRSVKPHITIVAPIEMLSTELADAEAAGAVGVTPDGTVLSAATTRMLLCDAAVRRLVVDPAGQPLDIGRATRNWSGPQRAALAAVDGGCRGPHCDRPFAWTDIHHIQWWRNQGPTSIENGVPACHHCHDLVHHKGWSVSLEPATRVATWTSPTGDVIVTHPRGPAAELAPPTLDLAGAGREGSGHGEVQPVAKACTNIAPATRERDGAEPGSETADMQPSGQTQASERPPGGTPTDGSPPGSTRGDQLGPDSAPASRDPVPDRIPFDQLFDPAAKPPDFASDSRGRYDVRRTRPSGWRSAHLPSRNARGRTSPQHLESEHVHPTPHLGQHCCREPVRPGPERVRR